MPPNIESTKLISPPCPVLDDQAHVATLTTDLARYLRKLERDLHSCPACASYETCPLLADLNQTIDAALQQVTDEWNLSPRT